MLSNLWNEAEEGCLLGVAVWREAAKLNPVTLFFKCIEELGLKTQEVRRIEYLFDKVEGMGAKTGWELVVNWDQEASFHAFDIEGFKNFARFYC